MSLKNLQPFQVDPDRVDRQEIANLVNKVSINSKVSEIQGLFDRNISLCAYLLKQAYIDYHKIYFLSTSLILSEEHRPDYICACYHPKKGLSWYAIICAGPQEQTWDDDLQLTPGAKLAFDRLNYCTSNLERILLSNKLLEEVNQGRIHGLLIIGQDTEFFQNPNKQTRKRNINQNSPVKLRTYGAFLRRFENKKQHSWLINKLSNFLNR
ncbi:hypothetical protein [Chamaesiphon sp. VAR_48_metabat_135_sub]|uniref:hypothetical protein n=1 Tax=Chamaesiphon sp. VAR_48_metabat_135_sub TaxID=2964699 RepID=UPI00286B13BD|nr:hypothetical protein [Chamaesiphon sp. VAR_48_metabat_135_sub]